MTSDQSPERRRGVTRGYVVGLIGATGLVALALVVASWGLIGMFSGRQPVSSPGLLPAAAEWIVLLALIVLALGLWLQALALLRGRRRPPWAHTLAIAGCGYFVWCLGGVLVGMSIDETWVSPFALALALIWAIGSLLFWLVLARRVYTERPVPRWPWERRGDREGPDWIRYGEDDDGLGDGPWGGGDGSDGDLGNGELGNGGPQ